jgi:hypothetical protein
MAAGEGCRDRVIVPVDAFWRLEAQHARKRSGRHLEDASKAGGGPD